MFVLRVFQALNRVYLHSGLMRRSRPHATNYVFQVFSTLNNAIFLLVTDSLSYIFNIIHSMLFSQTQYKCSFKIPGNFCRDNFVILVKLALRSTRSATQVRANLHSFKCDYNAHFKLRYCSSSNQLGVHTEFLIVSLVWKP